MWFFGSLRGLRQGDSYITFAICIGDGSFEQDDGHCGFRLTYHRVQGGC